MPTPRRKSAPKPRPCIVTVDDDGTIPVPVEWRIGDVISVYKRGERFLLINHRTAQENGLRLPPGASYTETIFSRPEPVIKPKRMKGTK
jgi:bifunctional DNA-binding transcriptional regulator/antitoxin component of YhaV-PrlF toxin-antitoxin module